MFERIFKLRAAGSSVGKEVLGGLTTFVAMAYIIVVNPKILEAAGVPFGPSLVATALTAFLGTLAMALYAKRPFAVAPYMGENAFIAFTVVGLLGFSWQQALAAVFVSGVLFVILTVLKVRSWLAGSIPLNLRIAFAAGIGFFLIFLGLNLTDMVRLGVEGAPVHVGNFRQPVVLLAIATFLGMMILMAWKVPGAILIAILASTAVAMLTGLASVPPSIWSAPPDVREIAFQLDFSAFFTVGFLGVALCIFVLDLVDTIGTLIGLSFKSGLGDEEGNLPDVEKPMLCDAGATTVGALLGTSTSGIFIESSAGIESGGRTGLASLVTAFCFLGAIFVVPLASAIPTAAYGPALIAVGLAMFTPLRKLKFDDFTEVVPVFATIGLMSFTYNLGIGITAGFLLQVLLKTVTGRASELRPGLWVLAGLSFLFYCFYPY